VIQEFQEKEPGVFSMPYVIYGNTVNEFVAAAYEHGWVLRGFDWPGWAQSTEATNLRDDEAVLAQATPEQLMRLLTVVIRQDRFAEGALLDAFESGLILRIVRRATAILEEENSQPS
jgi:Family of unknown function (DUF6508)